MNIFLGPIFIAVLTVVGVEFGVWIMKGMLGGDGEHHGARTPFARVGGYVVGVIAFVAFLSLATGARAWALLALVVAIPLAIVLAYRKPASRGA